LNTIEKKMKTVGTLRKKGLGGAEHFMRKDKNKQQSNTSSVSSPSGSNVLSPKSTPSPYVSHASTPKTAPSAPITVDLHRFADESLQPEECESSPRRNDKP
jgi:hypothetical protein